MKMTFQSVDLAEQRKLTWKSSARLVMIITTRFQLETQFLLILCLCQMLLLSYLSRGMCIILFGLLGFELSIKLVNLNEFVILYDTSNIEMITYFTNE